MAKYIRGGKNPETTRIGIFSRFLTFIVLINWLAIHKLSKNKNVKAHMDKYENEIMATIHGILYSGCHDKGPSRNPSKVKMWQLRRETSKQTCTALSVWIGLKIYCKYYICIIIH